MKLPYMPFWVADYRANTGHLNAKEHGAYLLLIMHYWSTGGLPKDDLHLARIAACQPEEWEEIRPTIAQFFEADWRHSRIDFELQDAEAKYNARVEAGRKGGNARAKLKQSHSNARAKGIAKPKQPELEPELEPFKIIEGGKGKSRKEPETRIADDWVPKVGSIEKAQKLGFTPREIQREAEKFKNHARQKDRRAVRWDAAFDNWMINAAEYQNKRPTDNEIDKNRWSGLPASAEWMAWKAHFQDKQEKVMIRLLDQRELENRAFSFPSRWPPGHIGGTIGQDQAEY